MLALINAGIDNTKPLPVANKTVGKNNDLSAYYTNDIKEISIAVFGPFLEKYNYSFPEEWGGKNTFKKQIRIFSIRCFKKIKSKIFQKNQR